VILEYKGKHINAKGIVVRSELTGIEEKADWETITIYSVGLSFKDESADKVKDFLALIENNKKTQVPVQADWFCRDVRFCIITSSENVLNLPTHFGVKDISQKGIIIQTDLQLKIDSVVLLELSIGTCDPVSFVGKVVSCRIARNKIQSNYNIGVEFSKLTDQSRSLLKRFIDFIKDNEPLVSQR
jgi:Tfp pilus assembly protein PilZ